MISLTLRARTCLLPLLLASSAPALAQFSTHDVLASQIPEATGFFVADLDGDGRSDVVVTSEGDDRVAWYRNLGLGQVSGRLTISTQCVDPQDVRAADLDGDGDTDVVVASSGDDTVSWFENVGSGAFGPRQLITGQAPVASGVRVADVNGDGLLDVLAAFTGTDTVAWFANQGGGNFGTAQPLPWTVPGVRGLEVADLDGDGDVDVVCTSPDQQQLWWFPNVDAGTFGNRLVIDQQIPEPSVPVAADMDSDGLPDILVLRGASVLQFGNQGGTFMQQSLSLNDVRGFRAVAPTDLEGDGDTDLLLAGPFYGSAFENITEPFPTRTQILTSSELLPTFVSAIELNGDGAPDALFLSRTRGELTWCKNTGPGAIANRRTLTDSVSSPRSVLTADFDGDGDPDCVIAGAMGGFGLVENLGQGSFGALQALSSPTFSPLDASSADIDGDGDLDILTVADNQTQTFAWHENLGGLVFGPSSALPSAVNGGRSIEPADVDGDGDLDAIVSVEFPASVGWFENTGAGAFGPLQTIAIPQNNSIPGVFDLVVGDWDGDGDPDIAYTVTFPGRLIQVENLGSGNFGPEVLISSDVPNARGMEAADLDQDGDLDLLCSSVGNNTLSWFENPGDGQFGTEHVVSALAHSVGVVRAGDMDGDGDLDVVSSSFDFNRSAWYKNLGGGVFGSAQTLSNREPRTYGLALADIEGDGDLDVVLGTSVFSSLFSQVSWYENTHIGTRYCDPMNPNSAGLFSGITAFGSDEAALNEVTLRASGLPPGGFGMFLNGPAPGFVSQVPGSQGQLCLSGQIGRYVNGVFFTRGQGTGSLVLDLDATPTPLGFISLVAGQTYHFQAWYRDANPGPTSNFTSGLSITFQ